MKEGFRQIPPNCASVLLREIICLLKQNKSIKWHRKETVDVRRRAQCFNLRPTPSVTSKAIRPSFEPSHEIMVLFVLRKLILQTRMRSHLMGLDVRFFFIRLFLCFHTLCARTAKALARLRGCAGLPEPLLVAKVISTKISWAVSFRSEVSIRLWLKVHF